MDDMVDAMQKEIKERRNYLSGLISTIYFGGGTPSVLSPGHIGKLLEELHKNYRIVADEITLEANPEDLLPEKLKGYQDLGINRLSIGVQTFDDERLRWMNRAHSSKKSIESYEKARNAGFENISLDLIYALPGKKDASRKKDLEMIKLLSPEHVSFYGLTIEPKTVFGNWLKKNKLYELPEEIAANEYLEGVSLLEKNGYIHYEVSNLSKPGYESIHNSNYWDGTPYIGIGPGAHSFDGKSRQMNIDNNPLYIKKINAGEVFFETEHLTYSQATNEKILTGLRTKKGLAFSAIDAYNIYTEKLTYLQSLQEEGLIKLAPESLSLTTKGFLHADSIALELFTSS